MSIGGFRGSKPVKCPVGRDIFLAKRKSNKGIEFPSPTDRCLPSVTGEQSASLAVGLFIRSGNLIPSPRLKCLKKSIGKDLEGLCSFLLFVELFYYFSTLLLADSNSIKQHVPQNEIFHKTAVTFSQKEYGDLKSHCSLKADNINASHQTKNFHRRQGESTVSGKCTVEILLLLLRI